MNCDWALIGDISTGCICCMSLTVAGNTVAECPQTDCNILGDNKRNSEIETCTAQIVESLTSHSMQQSYSWGANSPLAVFTKTEGSIFVRVFNLSQRCGLGTQIHMKPRQCLNFCFGGGCSGKKPKNGSQLQHTEKIDVDYLTSKMHNFFSNMMHCT